MPNINIESFCISKNFNKVVMGSEKRCGGIVCYSFGSLSYAEEEASQAFVSDSARIKKTAGDKGIIHGALCRIHLGYRLSEISKNKGVVIWFSICSGQVEINSYSLNQSNQFSDGKKEMNFVEAEMIKYIIN